MQASKLQLGQPEPGVPGQGCFNLLPGVHACVRAITSMGVALTLVPVPPSSRVCREVFVYMAGSVPAAHTWPC